MTLLLITMNRKYIESLILNNKLGKLIKLSIENINNWSEDDYHYLYYKCYRNSKYDFMIFIDNNNDIFSKYNITYGSDVLLNINNDVTYTKHYCNYHNNYSQCEYKPDVVKYMFEMLQYGIVKDMNQRNFKDMEDDEYDLEINRIYESMNIFGSKKFYMLFDDHHKYNNQYQIFLNHESMRYYTQHPYYSTVLEKIFNIDNYIIDDVFYDTLIRCFIYINKECDIRWQSMVLETNGIMIYFFENTRLKKYINIPEIQNIIKYH